MHKQVCQRTELLLTITDVQILANRLIVWDVYRHSGVRKIPLWIRYPAMDVVRAKTLVHSLKLGSKSLRVTRWCVVTNQMALHAIIVIRNYPHGSIKMPRMLLLSNINCRLIETRVVNIRVLSSIHYRKVVNQCGSLARLQIELGHPEDSRWPNGVRVQKELVKPRRLNFFPFANKWRGKPAPCITRLDIGINCLLILNHNWEEQSCKISTFCRVVLASLYRVFGNKHIRPTNEPRLTIDKSIFPERHRSMKNDIFFIWLDRNPILINQLWDSCFRIKNRHTNDRRAPSTGSVDLERITHLIRREMPSEERIVIESRRFAHRLRLVRKIPTVHLERMTSGAVKTLSYHKAIKPCLLTRCWVVDKFTRWRISDETEDKSHHFFPLLCIKRELRHSVALVIRFVFNFFVIVAPRTSQLLPKKTFSLMPKQLL